MSLRVYRLVLATLAGTLLATIASAQGPNVFRNYAPDLSGGFIEPPRLVRQQLDDAQKAVDEQRYSDAVLGLGKLLQRSSDAAEDDIAGQDFFLDASGENPEAIAIDSLMRRAEDLLGSLPDKGLDLYELNYGPAAKKALAEAMASEDWVALKDVVRRYFHTEAGYRAAYVWGYHELQTGRPLAASILFQRLAAQRRAAATLGGQLDLALARSLQLAGRDPDQVAAALRPVDGAAPPRAAAYRIAGAEVAPAAAGQEQPWLESHFASLQRTAPPAPVDYPVAGGDASRALSEGGQRPLGALRWKLETTTGAGETRELLTTAQSLASQGELPPPTWLPLRVGNQLLMRTTERVMGVDFQSGKRVWEYPWESSTEQPEQLPFDAETDVENGLLNQRVWFDLPYGRMSSDGERVYLLQDLSQIEANRRYTPFGVRAIQQGIAERQNAGANTLVALELKSEGKLLWRAGVGEETPTIFSDAFFLGPPLPIEGRLYVIAELAGDIYLLCLDPATGNQLWRQQLLAIEAGDIETDIVRRVAGAMPAYQDGVLVCPTGAGAIVAIDLASRSLLWGVKYRRNSDLDNVGMGRGGLEPSQLMQRWHDGTPLIVDGGVYVTPIEADRLLGFDLLTGKPLFPEIARSGMRYLAGVREDQMILVGTREVYAYDKRSGQRRWTATLNEAGDNAQVSGTGVFGGNQFFVPLSNRQIASVDLATGEVVHRQAVDFDPGNLVQAGGQLISQSPTELTVTYGQEWLRPIVEERLAENSVDPWTNKRKAQLLIEDGQRDESLQWLAQALQSDADDEEARSLYVAAMLGALREDYVAHTDLLPKLENLVRLPERRAELLSLMARGNVQQKHPEQAIERLVELSALVANESELSLQMRNLQGSDAESWPSLDSWIAGQVSQAVAAATGPQLEKIHQAVALHLQSFEAGPSSTLQRLTQHFAGSSGADLARQKLVARLITEGALLPAERMALEALDDAGSDADRAAPFHLLLAGVYENASFNSDARNHLDRLQQLTASLPDSIDEQQQAKLEALQQDLPAIVPNRWPEHVISQWNSPQIQRTQPSSSPDVLGISGRSSEHLRSWQAISEEGRTISLRDPYGRVTSIPMPIPDVNNDGPRTAVVDRGVMVALMPSELLAIDLFRASQGSRDAVLWRHPWRSELGGRVARAGSMATPFGDNHKSYEVTDPLRRSPLGEYRLGPISGNTLYVLNAGELQAVDALQGSVRWANSGAPSAGYVLATEDRVAVASPQGREGRVDIFAAVDGRKLDTQPWPEGERIWCAAGRHLLTYQVATGNVPSRVTLRNVFDESVVLEQELTPPETPGVSVKGHIAEGRWLTLLQPSGEIVIWDLLEGRQVGTHTVDPIEKLHGLQVLVRDDTLILLPETSVRPPQEPNTMPHIAQANIHFQVHGPLVCMHQQTGEVVWETPLEDAPWGCTVGQATGSPLLIFSRALSIHSSTTSTRRVQELSLLALDVRSGKTVAKHQRLKLPSVHSDIGTSLSVDPEQHVVAALVGSSFMQYSFSDQPPPAGPAAEENDAQAESPPETDELDEVDEPKPFDLFR